jgi:large subunit ribosomal protein L27
MATKKAAGSAKNISYNNPQYLGIKLYAGEHAKVGNIIVRQRGTRFMAGKNTRVAKDHSIFAMKNGTVSYRLVRKTKFDGSSVKRQKVDVM